MLTALESARDSVTVTGTEDPSTTRLGAESETVARCGVPLPNTQPPAPAAFLARTRTR